MLSSGDEDQNYQNSRGNKGKKNVAVSKKTLNELKINCEWINCNQTLDNLGSAFYRHVTYHLSGSDLIGIGEDEEEIYKCNWSTCNFETKDPKEITRHVKYHGYHAELRALGSYVAKTKTLPPCVVQSEFSILNYVDDSPLICNWSHCNETCEGILEFIDHVHFHIKQITPKFAYKCKWIDCRSAFQSKSKLTDHIKTHTKQHYIACPQCGHTFANTTKFVDHCLTQKPFEGHTYQCDYCLSFHPSERILRKHMGQHIHHYKCPFCNMTCNKPSLLAKHIRYRHLNYRAFKCSLCDYKGKSKQDLQWHVLTHVKGIFRCQEPGCSFFTGSQILIKRHVETAHVPGKGGFFCCHICDKKYGKGFHLTKHLASKHNLKRPPGYSRFQYRLESDGNRRLQTTRLESLEIHDVGFDPSSNDEELGEDSELPAGNDGLTKAIAVEVLGESGQIVSSSVVIPEDSLPPEDAEILAVGV